MFYKPPEARAMEGHHVSPLPPSKKQKAEGRKLFTYWKLNFRVIILFQESITYPRSIQHQYSFLVLNFIFLSIKMFFSAFSYWFVYLFDICKSYHHSCKIVLTLPTSLTFQALFLNFYIQSKSVIVLWVWFWGQM